MVLWGEEKPRSRGPKPSLTLDGIAAAGIAIAASEGLAAVSMQRVAAEVGCTKMALYRYLPGKAELVALMVERALGAPPTLPPDWRAALSSWTSLLLDGFLRNPWTLPATIGPRPLGPHELGWTEVALAACEGLPLSGSERLDTVATLAGHARSLAAQADLSESGLLGAMAAHAARFPALMAAMADATAPDQAFGFGLGRILDGLDVLITTRKSAGVKDLHDG